MSLDQITAVSKTACRGAFSLNRLSRAYTGPTFNIRRNTDNVTVDFYASYTGDAAFALNTAGVTLTSWLGGSPGYVAVWYDQSGSGNHATQGTASAQPQLNFANNTVDFLADSARFLSIPSGTIPTGTLNAPYSFVVKHGAVGNTATGAMLGAGGVTLNTANVMRCAGDVNKGYWNYWWANDYSFGVATATTVLPGNTVVTTYDGTARTGFINGVSYGATAGSGATTAAGAQYIGRDPLGSYLNGQLNYVLVFGSALPDADRVLLTAPVSTMALDGVTPTSKNACRGAYATTRLSGSYTGPTVNIRRSSDSVTSDFYADTAGNLGTALNATGTQLAAWLAGATAYIAAWYDQSGTGNHATQATTATQPVLTSTGLVDFLNDSTRFLSIPTGTVPTGTVNAPHTFTVKHGVVNNHSVGMIVSAGAWTANQANALYVYPSGYDSTWAAHDYGIPGTASAGDTFTLTFDGTKRVGYVNGDAKTADFSTGSTTAAGAQCIGCHTTKNAAWYFNGQMYFVYIFGAAVADADRIVLENGTLASTRMGQLAIALSDASVFSDVKTGDIAVAAFGMDNSLRLGGSQGAPSTMQVTQTGASVTGLLQAGSALVTGLFSMSNNALTTQNLNFTGTLLSNGAPHVQTLFTSAGANVYLMGSNLAVGKSNPVVELDVVGTLNASAAITQGGSNLSTIYAPLATSNAAVFGSNVAVAASNAAAVGVPIVQSQRFPPVSLSGAGTGQTCSVNLGGLPYGNGTYYITASSKGGSGTEYPSQVFDLTTSGWANVWTTYMAYNTSGVYTGATTTTVGGAVYPGEYIQLQLPYAIVPSYAMITEVNGCNATSMVIAGSTDGTTWTPLYVSSGRASLGVAGNNGATTTRFDLPSGTAYSYYRYIAGSIGSGLYGYLSMYEFAIYTPDFSTYTPAAKYPPASLAAAGTDLTGTATLTGQAYGNGSYTVSVPNKFDAAKGAGAAFDFNTSTSWTTPNSIYLENVGTYVGTSLSTTVDGSAVYGAWIQIQLPYAIVPSYAQLAEFQGGANAWASSAMFAGSTDGSTWTSLYAATGLTTPAAVTNYGFSTSAAYSYYRYIVRAGGGCPWGWFSLNEFAIYGSTSYWSTPSMPLSAASGIASFPPASLAAAATGLTGSATLSGKAYGNGTYYVSADTMYSTQYYPGNAFDFSGANTWAVPNATYNSGNGAYQGGSSTTVDGTAVGGAWVQLQLPCAIVPAFAVVTINDGRSVTSFVIAGSVDGVTWTSLYARTTAPPNINGANTFALSSGVTCSYFRIINRVATANTWGTLVMTEFSVTGKYVNTPSITAPPTFPYQRFPPASLAGAGTGTSGSATLYGPAGAGTYAISASSQYSTSECTVKAFNSRNINWGGDNWTSATVKYSTGGVYTAAQTTTVSGSAVVGEWVQLQLPYAVVPAFAQLVEVAARNATNMTIAGSVDGTTWTSLYSNASLPAMSTINDNTPYTNTYSTPTGTAYQYFRYIATAINPNGNTIHSIYEFAVYGARPVVQSLRFPPASLTAAGTGLTGNATLSGQTWGNGAYYVSASSQFSATECVSLAFDLLSLGLWTAGSAASALYNGSGVYTGSTTTTVSGTAHAGEWLQLQLPYAVVPSHIQAFEHGSRNATSMVIAGSVDGSTWTLLFSNAALPVLGTDAVNSYAFSTSTAYSYYRYIAKAVNSAGGGFHSIYEFAVFGNWQPTASYPAARYPPASLAAAGTGLTGNATLSGMPYGNGVYYISADTEFNTSQPPALAFDLATAGLWSTPNGTYNPTSGAYAAGTASTTVDGAAVTGSWIQIQLPAAIVASYATVKDDVNANRYATSLVIAASTNGTYWTALYANASLPATHALGATTMYTFTTNTAFAYYRMITRATAPSNQYGILAVNEFAIFAAPTTAALPGSMTTPYNVGIATTSPASPLDLAVGTMTLRNGSNTTPATLNNFQTLFGYSNTSLYPHGISTRHSAGGGASNSVDLSVWNGLALDQISSASKTACRGAYSLNRINRSYTGPTVAIRRSSDNAPADFYADIAGNLGTALDAGGVSLALWLAGDVAYVATWYDQSGSGNHATQNVNALQPILNTSGASPVVDFQNSSTQYLNMPSGTVPVGTLNAPYTFVAKHGTINNTSAGAILGAGTLTTNTGNNLRCCGSTNNGYVNYWLANDYTFGGATASTVLPGNIVAVTYDGTARTGYINGTSYAPVAASGYTTTAGKQYIGSDPNSEYLNGQLYYVLVFGSALPDADRLTLATAVTSATGTVGAMSVTAAGVGVLNSNPQYTLDVGGAGTGRFTGNVTANNASVYSMYTGVWAAFAHSNFANNVAAYAFAQDGAQNTGTVVNAPTGQPIKFSIDGVVQGTWSNAMMGAGTAAPAYTLDVAAGNMRVVNTGVQNMGIVLGNCSNALAVIEQQSTAATKSNETIVEIGQNLNRLVTGVAGVDVAGLSIDTRSTSRAFNYIAGTNNSGVGVMSLSYPSGNLVTTANIAFSNASSTGQPAVGFAGGAGDRLVGWPGDGSHQPLSLGVGSGTMWYSVPANCKHQWYQGGAAAMTLTNCLGIGTSTITAGTVLDINGPMLVRSGNTAASFSSNQIAMGYAGGTSYAHAINTRHQSPDGTGNAVDFAVWNNNVASTTVGTTIALSATNNPGIRLPTGRTYTCRTYGSGAAYLSLYNNLAWFGAPDTATFDAYLASVNNDAWFFVSGKLVHVIARGAVSGGNYGNTQFTAVDASGAAVTLTSLGYTGNDFEILIQLATAGSAVGVMNSNPAYQLDVAGASKFSGGVHGPTYGSLLLRAYDETSGAYDFRGRVIDYQMTSCLYWNNASFGGQSTYYSVRICGYISPPVTDTYTFNIYSDDGSRMWLNDTRIINAWYATGPTNFPSSGIPLTAGVWYPVMIEHMQTNLGETLQVSWKGATSNTAYQYLTHNTGATAFKLSCDLWECAPTRLGRTIVAGAMDVGSNVSCANVFQTYLLNGPVAAGGPTMHLNFANGGADASATGTYAATLAGSITTSSTTATISGRTVNYMAFTNNALTTSLTTSLNPTANAKTISYWVNTTRTDFTDNPGIGFWATGGYGSQFAMLFNAGRHLDFWGNYNDWAVGSSTFAWENTGAWIHVVFTMDNTNMIQMFVNGTPVGKYYSDYQMSTATVPTTTYAPKFAGAPTVTSGVFKLVSIGSGNCKSVVYNFRSILYYNRCLSHDEIESLYYTT